MFLNNKNDLGNGITYLESILKSVKDFEHYIDSLKTKFELPNSASVEEIFQKVEQLFDMWVAAENELDELRESTRYMESMQAKLLAESLANEVSANIANYALFEINSGINKLINDRLVVPDEEYFPYVLESLKKLQKVDPLQWKNVLENYQSKLNELKLNLDKKIDDFTRLKLEVASLIFDSLPSLESFDSDFVKFKDNFKQIKEKAAKYDLLLSTGSIRDVNNSISSKSAFHVSYGK
ncbi:MAG TPA: hypothetical protein PLP33_14880 [Leptospiraceae bacterium]|nr:hypothetical protein [Leptospiraceae bacterium]